MHIVRRPEEWQVSWTTISYRWVELLCAGLLLVAAFVLYLIFGARILALIESAHIGDKSASIEQQRQQTVPAPLTIDQLEGEVRMMRASAPSWVPARKGQGISPGDVLQTDSDSAAVLVIPGVIRLDVAPNSVVVLATARSTDDGLKVGLRLASGSLEFATDQVHRGEEPELLMADTTFIPVEQTSGRAWALAKSGNYSIVLLRGSGVLNRDADGFELKPFERATLQAGEQDFQLKQELAPPVLLAPEQGARMVVGNCSSPVEFSWGAVDAASAYHFRIASTRFFAEPITETTVFSRSLQLQLPQGDYFWQVEGVAAGRRLSLASPVSQFDHVCSQRLGEGMQTAGSP
jgi:hypothetical protein